MADTLNPAAHLVSTTATESGAPRPASGTGDQGVDWANVARHIATLPAATPGILEIAYDLEETPDSVTKKASQAFSDLLRQAESLQQSN